MKFFLDKLERRVRIGVKMRSDYGTHYISRMANN